MQVSSRAPAKRPSSPFAVVNASRRIGRLCLAAKRNMGNTAPPRRPPVQAWPPHRNDVVVPDVKTVTAAGGTVGYYEYGDPGGRPVMVFHGVPACGAGFAFADAAARQRGLRLVAPDRPGIGLSDLGA